MTCCTPTTQCFTVAPVCSICGAQLYVSSSGVVPTKCSMCSLNDFNMLDNITYVTTTTKGNRTGWQCPKCNRIWSPFVKQCECNKCVTNHYDVSCNQYGGFDTKVTTKETWSA